MMTPRGLLLQTTTLDAQVLLLTTMLAVPLLPQLTSDDYMSAVDNTLRPDSTPPAPSRSEPVATKRSRRSKDRESLDDFSVPPMRSVWASLKEQGVRYTLEVKRLRTKCEMRFRNQLASGA
jgi:hypothetical protein